MAAQPTPAMATENWLNLVRVATCPKMRALAWSGDVLYASRGYTLFRARMQGTASVEWEQVGQHDPALWRVVTSCSRLASRLFRDGFHALAILSTGEVVGAVPHEIVTLAPGETKFRTSLRVLRGTRPLHIAVTPNGRLFWGEYFDNWQREEVHVYASTDRGVHWDVAYTFAKGEIRHVHNIVYDKWEDCFWMLTGDDDSECRILRASCDFGDVEVVLSGNQQARTASIVPTAEALYFSSDTPLETNHIYRLDRSGSLAEVARLNGSSIYGCSVGNAVLFTTMVEPSKINTGRHVRVYGSPDGFYWQPFLQWEKDGWPSSLFQYGNAILPDGHNSSALLAVTTIAVDGADLETSIWRI